MMYIINIFLYETKLISELLMKKHSGNYVLLNVIVIVG